MGVLLGIFGGVCRPVLQILTRFQTKKCNFPHPFSVLAFRQKLLLSLLKLECKQKKSILIHFEFTYFSFFLTHLELNDKYVHTLGSSLENHTRFQTKIGKVCTRFQTKTALKPHPMGQHIPIWLVHGSNLCGYLYENKK